MAPLSPQAGDLLVCYEHKTDGYFIIDAVTREPVAGPFARLNFAVGIAHSLAHQDGGSVWRENLDGNGVVVGPPELISPDQKPLASATEHGRDEDDEQAPDAPAKP